MAQCKWCNRSGWFLSLNQEGLCKTCGPVLDQEVRERVQSLNDMLNVFRADKELDAALSHCDLIINQASSLIKFEAKGIVTLTTPPSVIVRQYQDAKEKLPREWFKAELESTLAGVAATGDSSSKAALLSLFLRKLQRYRSQASDRDSLGDLEIQASEALHEIREQAYESKVDPRQPPDTECLDDTYKDFLTKDPPVSSDTESEAPQITATAQNEKCPYCRQPLRKIPKRRALCPQCKKAIYVRAKQDIIPGTTLFTERDARAITWLGQIEVSRNEIEVQREKLSRQFGQTAQLGDVFWQIMNERVRVAMKKPRSDAAQQLQLLYAQMASFLYEEGRDHFRMSQQSARMGLVHWQKAMREGLLPRDRTRLEVITCGAESCPECRQLTGVKFTMKEVIDQMPLPVKGCTHEPAKPGLPGWCRCCYGLSFIDD